jgi:hypothetical protein
MDQQHQEIKPDSGTSLFQMNLDAQNSYNLRSAASWGKVLGVVGIIIGLFFLVVSINALSKIGSYNSYSMRRRGLDDMFGTSSKIGLWILILTGIIFILGGVFSYSFGNKINTALKGNDQQALNAGFASLRNYYATRSITLIVVLLLFLIIILNAM